MENKSRACNTVNGVRVEGEKYGGGGWMRERERRIKRNEREEIQAAARGEQVQTWPVRKSLTARGQKLPEGLVHDWEAGPGTELGLFSPDGEDASHGRRFEGGAKEAEWGEPNCEITGWPPQPSFRGDASLIRHFLGKRAVSQG